MRAGNEQRVNVRAAQAPCFALNLRFGDTPQRGGIGRLKTVEVNHLYAAGSQEGPQALVDFIRIGRE